MRWRETIVDGPVAQWPVGVPHAHLGLLESHTKVALFKTKMERNNLFSSKTR